MSNIWFVGVPGSKWSGVDIQLRRVLPCDKTDETPERVFYHAMNTPGRQDNGHRGSYWGPGMGCGENWTDFQKLGKEQIVKDINEVFTGNGYRVIKSHFFARHFNLQFLWDNFKDDYMILLYRESQASFAWWCNVMDFGEDHWPDYSRGYTDYNMMRTKIYEENNKILDFGIKKGLHFNQWNPNTSLTAIEGFNPAKAADLKKWPDDIYMAVTKIT